MSYWDGDVQYKHPDVIDQSLRRGGEERDACETTRAVDPLQQLGPVRVDESGRSRGVCLNRERVTIPDEPLFALPQDQFREPVRESSNRPAPRCRHFRHCSCSAASHAARPTGSPTSMCES
jgi:hypothetical protein